MYSAQTNVKNDLESINNIHSQSYNLQDLKLIDDYILNLRRLNKSEHTLINYRSDLIHFLKWLNSFNDVKLSDVNGEIIGKYKNFLNGDKEVFSNKQVNSKKQKKIITWLSHLFNIRPFLKRKRTQLVLKDHLLNNPNREALRISSKRRHLSSIKNFYEYLKESNEDHSNFFSKNPVKSKIHAITLKEIDVEHTPMISREEFQKIYENSFRTRDRLILNLLYYAGLRLSELCSLQISQFDEASRTITIHRKGGYVHTLSVYKSDLIFKDFNFYKNQKLQTTDFLFSNKEGIAIKSRTMYNIIIKIIERSYPQNSIQSKISPHSFRKACATELYLKTKDLLLVRDYLNHKDAKITQTYIDKKTLEQYSRKLH